MRRILGVAALALALAGSAHASGPAGLVVIPGECAIRKDAIVAWTQGSMGTVWVFLADGREIHCGCTLEQFESAFREAAPE